MKIILTAEFSIQKHVLFPYNILKQGLELFDAITINFNLTNIVVNLNLT